VIEFEHTLFIILLLSAVLNAKPPRRREAIFIILVGILLVFIPPAQTLLIPWNLILGFVLPLLLWQNIRRIVNANWRGWKSVVLWTLTVLIMGTALWLGGALMWPGALLFGVISASMIWRAGEPEFGASFMSQVGPLTVVFLITEVETAIQSPDHYLGGLFSGASIGAGFALMGLFLLRKATPKFHNWIGLGQVYLAYGFAFIAGVSAVAAALVAVMVFIWLNQHYQLGYHLRTPSAPLNTWLGFGMILALFLLLGWQAHQPLSILLIVEVLIGAFIGLFITWVGRWLALPAFQNNKPFWVVGLRISLLLFPALLLWPRDMLDTPQYLLVALGISILVIGLAHTALSYYYPQRRTELN
jgi:hypothetical protein